MYTEMREIMVFNATFSCIVAVSFTGGGNPSTWKNHRHAGSHWQTWSHNVVSNTPRNERNSNWQLVLWW